MRSNMPSSGNGWVGSEVIVMFNGTKGVLADWPIQMLTNSRASPLIVGTDGYSPQEDGVVSLCHDYRLVFKGTLDNTSFDLLFPYVGEPPNNGATIDCTATIDSTAQTVTLNVTPNCPNGSECAMNLAVQGANRVTSPWSMTKGVSADLFVQQRETDDDYSLCYCAAHDRAIRPTAPARAALRRCRAPMAGYARPSRPSPMRRSRPIACRCGPAQSP
jgi:hypothetical protein